MTQRSRDIDTFYNFAEMCNDEMEVMSLVLKKHFTQKRLSRIRYQLEHTVIGEYIETMKIITDEEINKVFNKIANDKGTLF